MVAVLVQQVDCIGQCYVTAASGGTGSWLHDLNPSRRLKTYVQSTQVMRRVQSHPVGNALGIR